MDRALPFAHRAAGRSQMHSFAAMCASCRCGVCQGASAMSLNETLRRLSLAVDCFGAQWVRYDIMVSSPAAPRRLCGRGKALSTPGPRSLEECCK